MGVDRIRRREAVREPEFERRDRSCRSRLAGEPGYPLTQRRLPKCVRQQAGSYRLGLMPMRVNRPGVGGGSYQAARSGLGHCTRFASQASRGWPSPIGAGFQRLARSCWSQISTFGTLLLEPGFMRLPRSCRSRLAGEPGYPFNAAVPAEMRSPASRLLQIRVGANAGEPCQRQGWRLQVRVDANAGEPCRRRGWTSGSVRFTWRQASRPRP